MTYGKGSIMFRSLRSASSVDSAATISRVLATPASVSSIRSSVLPPSRPNSSMWSASYAVSRSSNSQRAPMMPPRFIVPMATTPSRAPSHASSSKMSALAMTPSTPGTRSALITRSSKVYRSATASGSGPTANMPRAVWSTATISRFPSSPTSSRRTRPLRADCSDCGARTRASMSAA